MRAIFLILCLPAVPARAAELRVLRSDPPYSQAPGVKERTSQLAKQALE